MFFFFFLESESKLIVESSRLGEVEEITSFLIDLNTVYQQLSIFFIITSTDENISDKVKNAILNSILVRAEKTKRRKQQVNLKNIIKRVGPKVKILNLRLDKINIQSPGVWELVGSLNPLQQMREYLKDKHDRNKDREYRNNLEKAKGILELEKQMNEVVQQRISNLKSVGYSDEDIQKIVLELYSNPLKLLDKHLNSGLIEGAK